MLHQVDSNADSMNWFILYVCINGNSSQSQRHTGLIRGFR